jgi:hypothetical protein
MLPPLVSCMLQQQQQQHSIRTRQGLASKASDTRLHHWAWQSASQQASKSLCQWCTNEQQTNISNFIVVKVGCYYPAPVLTSGRSSLLSPLTPGQVSGHWGHMKRQRQPGGRQGWALTPHPLQGRPPPAWTCHQTGGGRRHLHACIHAGYSMLIGPEWWPELESLCVCRYQGAAAHICYTGDAVQGWAAEATRSAPKRQPKGQPVQATGNGAACFLILN